MTAQCPDLLARLETDLLDWTTPLSALLTICMMLAGRTHATQLQTWATAELKGYPRMEDVPDYRKVAAPIMQVIELPYRGRSTQPLNVLNLPDAIREHINEIVPLNQGVEGLESLAVQHEAQNRRIELGVFAGDAYVAVWNRNPNRRFDVVALYWAVAPAQIREVLGHIRAALVEFVINLRAEVGDGGQLPSAAQAEEALRAAVPAIFNNSTVTFMTTKEGDIMPEGPRTMIKGNTTKIEGASGNISVASANVNQVNAEGIDVEKIREFAALIAQIAPTLGLAEAQQAELQSGADELQEAVSAAVPEKGRTRRALDRVMGVLRGSGPTAARMVAIGMGDELMRELGSGIVGQLPH